MTDRCSEVRDAIALEGRAPENESLLEHLGECAECAEFLESVLAVEDELASLATVDVDEAVVNKLLARPELSSKGRSHKLRWAMGLAAAATIAFIAARVTLMGQASFSVEETAYFSRPGSGGSSGSDVNAPATVQPEGAELSPEQMESPRSLGYIAGGDSSELADDRLRENTTTRDQVIRLAPPGAAEIDNQEKLKGSVQDLNKRYSGTDEDFGGLAFENKNEAPKKDGATGEAAGFAGGSYREEALPEVAAASPPPPPPPPSGGRVDAPADPQEVSPYTETITITGASPVVDVTSTTIGQAELDKARVATDDFRSRLVTPETNSLAETVPDPKKLVHIDAVYPESAKAERLSGTVVLRAVIDRGGNVTQTILVDSVAAFDRSAIDAVTQWKYEASEQEQRTVTVRIAFEAPADPDNDARLFLEERERIDNLRFRDARGYWANTYLPGDSRARFLAMRLRNANQLVAPHLAARPVVQPFDAPTRGALSVTLHADRRGVSGPQRLLLQVGVKAAENYGRRRPPMNVGIVLDADPNDLTAARALVDSLQQAKALGDRFRLIVPGKGEVVSPETFQHGPLTVALEELEASSRLETAVRLAVERVHAGDDPTMPLGSSLVLVITPRQLGSELDPLARLAHRSAVGGVPVSVIGVGAGVDRDELERLALSGQGRRYFLEQAADATGIVDRELAASSRVVARALRLRIKLGADVRLVDVIGSESLSERQAEQIREAEKSIDLRLSRNLGIEADRGEDEDGIQIVIPSFYAGDTHTILLDVVATRPGAIAEVTARYKDLSELRNTVAKASLSLSRSEAAPGPLETNVLKNFLSHRLSEELENAADELHRGDRDAAVARLNGARDLLTGLEFGNDTELTRDIAMLGEYINVLSSNGEATLMAYLVDSLRYAGASKRRLHTALT